MQLSCKLTDQNQNKYVFILSYAIKNAPGKGIIIIPYKESLAPLSNAKAAISYGFEIVVLRILPIEARADDPLPPAGAEQKGKEINSKMDVDPILSYTVSKGAHRQLMLDPSSVLVQPKLRFFCVQVDHKILYLRFVKMKQFLYFSFIEMTVISRSVI